jgi:hypothetical protein
LLLQALDIVEKEKMDFPYVQDLLRSIKNARKAEEYKKNAQKAEGYKKNAFVEFENQEWTKVEVYLISAIDMDPTDVTAVILLSHLRSLLKAKKMVEQLSLGVAVRGDRSKNTREIREIIERTNETVELNPLWQQVVKLFGEYKSIFVPQEITSVLFILLISAGLLGGLSANFGWVSGLVIAVILFGVSFFLYILIIFSLIFKR